MDRRSVGAMRQFATPGFLDAVRRQGIKDLLSFTPAIRAFSILSKGCEPSWVIGDPITKSDTKDDEGRTLKIQASFRFYAIRDDHSSDCDCGCGGGSVITLLLPDEY